MSTTKWMSQLTRDFGYIAGDMPEPENSIIRLPSPSLNYCVGNGGIIEGKALCLFGPESGGKSLLMQLILAEIQNKHKDGICILFDTEYSFNKRWFEKLGGDLSRLVVRQTNDPLKIFDYMEKDILEKLQDGMPLKGIAIDSVKAIRYPGDHKSKTTDISMGGSGAKYLGPALKGLLPIIRDYGITTTLVQQVYEELDQYKAARNPYKLPDGRALKHFCDYMLQVEKLDTKSGAVEAGKNMIGSDNQVGHKVRVKAKKNRCAAPYRVAEFTLEYEKGIVNTPLELFNLAESLGVIYHPISATTGKPNNTMWKFAQHDDVKGKENMIKLVFEDKALQTEMYDAIMNASDSASETRNAAIADDGLSSFDIDLENITEE